MKTQFLLNKMSKIIKFIELRYENHYENSNKFYIITMYDDFTIITRWGRIGNNGRTQTKKFQFLWSAESYFNKRKKEKEQKGYYLYQHNHQELPTENPKLNPQSSNNSTLIVLDIWDAEF